MRAANVVLWIVLLALPAVHAIDLANDPPPDVRAFYAAARLIEDGRDPYDAVAWSTALAGYPQEGDRFAYPLWTGIALVPLAFVPLATAAAIWLFLLIASTAIGIVLVWRATCDRPMLVFAAIVLTSQPFWFTLEAGQFGGILLALSGLTLWAGAGRRAVTGIPVALLAVKPHVTFAIAAGAAAWLVGRAPKALALAVTLGVAMLVISLVVRPGWIAAWTAELGSPSRSESPNNHTSIWYLAPLVGLPAWTAAAVIVPLVIALGREAIRARGSLVDLVAAGAVCGLLLLPYQGSYDQLVLAPVWARALAIGLERPARRWLLLGLLGCASVLPWVLYAFALRARPDESLNALVLIATAVLLWAALRMARSDGIPEPETRATPL